MNKTYHRERLRRQRRKLLEDLARHWRQRHGGVAWAREFRRSVLRAIVADLRAHRNAHPTIEG